MSIWTHVAGIIRIDHLAIPRELITYTVKKIFDERSPSGSEGGLDFHIERTQELTPMGGSLCWGFVTFAGDLRDYDNEDAEEIIRWLIQITEKLRLVNAIIRQGIVAVHVETDPPHFLNYNCEKREWEWRWIEECKKENGPVDA